MNCNTTHYRANSSSVPGDPTAACKKTKPVAIDAGVGAVVVEDASLPEPAPPVTGVKALPVEVDASSEKPAADETRYIRQIRRVMVDEVEETWVLRWRGKPRPSCVTKEERLPCACWGFTYGETGQLELARMRPDAPEEVFDFRKHLEEDPQLQHRIPDKDDPLDRELSAAELKKLPIYDAMEIADYDHDGRATELLFRVGVGGACGHTSTMRAIGISKKNPKLHFFGVEMRRDDWDKVRTADAPGTVDIIDIRCGDHGSGEEISRVVRFDGKGNLETKEKTRQCGPNE